MRLTSEEEVYARHAIEYEALVEHEDYEGNILKAIQETTPLGPGMDVLDAGAGTGRLARLLLPYVRRVIACDLSPHMLGGARNRLREAGSGHWAVAAADHLFLPLRSRSLDLLVSGWSVSYVAVWYPDQWREKAAAWFAEARRVVHTGGHIILFESLGTGEETPRRLPHLMNFYGWLDKAGFQNRWIRTDYRFDSAESAAKIAGFFFGGEMQRKILRDRLAVLPECTGVWWLRA